MFFGGIFEQSADCCVWFAGGGVGEDVATGGFVGFDQFEGFCWQDAEAFDAGFGFCDQAAPVFPAQVLPLEMTAFVETKPGGVHDMQHGFFEGSLFQGRSAFEEVGANGLYDQLELGGAWWLWYALCIW